MANPPNADAATLLQTQAFPATNPPKMIDNRAIHYQKTANKITLTTFEGGREFLKNGALNELTTNPPSSF